MAFQQKEWKNRLSEHPTRRLLTPTDGSDAFEVDVTREEGTIMQQGDPFSAANMNDLEQRIADGIGGGDENMAPIEEGPESENAYAVGQLLIYGGQLYRVISAIAIGNTLVEDVNIEATTISTEFVGELTANGNRIYMDYQNGKYGVNTSPTRGADTFHPFSNLEEVTGYSNKWTMRLSGQNTYSGTWQTYTLPKQAKVYVYCATEGSAERRSCTSNVTNGEIYDEGFVVTISYSYGADATNRQGYYFAAITAVWMDD